MHLPPIKSKQEVWQESSYVEFDGGFVPAFMGDGGRALVKGFYIRIYGTITVGTAAWDGRSVCRLISHLAVETVSGSRRWSLSGEKSRAASIRYNGIESHNEHANVAIGAAQAVDLLLYIPMEKKLVAQGTDFAMAPETLSKIAITWASLASAADSGGAALSAAALSAYVWADMRAEQAVDVKSEDLVKSVDFSSQTEHVVKLTGLLHDADIVRETGAAGGASITAITDVRCDELGIPPNQRVDLKRHYLQKRGLGNVSSTSIGGLRFHEPVIDDQMLPIIVADGETAPWDGKVVEQAKFNLGAGAANLSLITREILPRNEQNFHAQAVKHGFSESALAFKGKNGTTKPLHELKGRRGQLQKKVGVLTHPLGRG